MDEPHEGKTFAPGWPCWKIKGKKALEQEGVKSKQSKIHIINVLLNSVGRSVRESKCLYRTDRATKKDFFGQTDRPRPKTSGKYYPIQNSHTVKQAFIIEQPGFYYLPPPGGYVSTCVCLSVCLFVCLSVYLSVYLFVCVCLSVCRQDISKSISPIFRKCCRRVSHKIDWTFQKTVCKNVSASCKFSIELITLILCKYLILTNKLNSQKCKIQNAIVRRIELVHM